MCLDYTLESSSPSILMSTSVLRSMTSSHLHLGELYQEIVTENASIRDLFY